MEEINQMTYKVYTSELAGNLLYLPQNGSFTKGIKVTFY